MGSRSINSKVDVKYLLIITVVINYGYIRHFFVLFIIVIVVVVLCTAFQ